MLKEVDANNWDDCISLEVLENQKEYISPNWYSVLQSTFGKDLYPMCIYDGKVMVGFLMYDLDPATKRMELSRLMIDKKYQGKQYGKIAVQNLLDKIRKEYGSIKFYTSTVPENIKTQKLFEGLGFKKTGEIMWDEIVYVIQL